MNDEYRFRLRDVASQAVRDMTMICLDDEAALLLAERFALGHDVEVWQAERFLGLVPSEGVAAPAAAPAEPAGPPPRRFKPFWAGAWRRGAEQA
jgi:hypothetical protein